MISRARSLRSDSTFSICLRGLDVGIPLCLCFSDLGIAEHLGRAGSTQGVDVLLAVGDLLNVQYLDGDAELGHV